LNTFVAWALATPGNEINITARVAPSNNPPIRKVIIFNSSAPDWDRVAQLQGPD
jgi:hypothetical protein